MHSVPLPPHLVAKAREYADGVHTPVEPRNAATVILLRPGAEGPEVYLLRRQTTMAFAAGMCVFPGGGVDVRDFDAEVGWTGPDRAAWGALLGCDAVMAGALVCAAVRELFEEAGVLLAGPDPESVVADTTGADWEADRVALEARELSLTALLERRGLVLRADLLRPWGAWVTPEFEPRRFRAWVFLAELPAGQLTRDVSTESDQVVWLPAQRALATVDSGELMMLPPTYLSCLEVAQYADPAAALAAADGRVVEMFMPELVSADDAVLSIPRRFDSLLDEHLGGRR